MELNNIKKILIINLGGIGDLLLSQPALGAIRAKYKEAAIDILVVKRTAELAKDYGIFNSVFIFRKNIPALLGLLIKLRANKYELAINMRTMLSWLSAWKMFFVFTLIHPRAGMGRDTQNRGFFLDIKIPEKNIGEKYEMEYDIDTAKALGTGPVKRQIELNVPQEAQERIKSILGSFGAGVNDKIVGIHPGGMPSRRWPLENFIELIRQISEKIDCKFVITGSNDELPLADKLREAGGQKIINLAGRLNTKELCAVIKRCALFVSGDTGPMHIAAVLGVPQIALLGPGDITRFDPRNISGNAVVFYKKSECAPCNRFRCGSLKCLKIIRPEEVSNACLSLLNR